MPSTFNGVDLLIADVFEPRAGVWHADIQADSTEDLGAPGAAATIVLEDSETFIGTVLRGGVDQGRYIARVIGGAAGLRTEIAAKHYVNVTFGQVLADIMTATGETLSSATAAAVTGHVRASWQRARGKGSAALSALVDILNAASGGSEYVWRVERDGTILLAEDAFAELTLAAVEIDDDPALGWVSVAPDTAPALSPGVSFGGVSVDYVMTQLAGGSIRQRYWSR